MHYLASALLWIKANPWTFVGYLYTLLNLLNALLPSPKAQGLLGRLHQALDIITALKPKSLCLPGRASNAAGKDGPSAPAAALLIGALLIPATARAEVPTWSTGPSVGFARFGFDCKPGAADPCFNMLKAGAGWTLRYNTPARSKDGNTAYLSLDSTALADLSTLPTGGSLSVAFGPSFYNGLIGVQTGVKLFDIVDGQPAEGLFTLSGGRRDVFFLINFSVNFIFSSPTQAKGLPAGQLPPNFFKI